jgi:hypothetical protein
LQGTGAFTVGYPVSKPLARSKQARRAVRSGRTVVRKHPHAGLHARIQSEFSLIVLPSGFVVPSPTVLGLTGLAGV